MIKEQREVYDNTLKTVNAFLSQGIYSLPSRLPMLRTHINKVKSILPRLSAQEDRRESMTLKYLIDELETLFALCTDFAQKGNRILDSAFTRSKPAR